MIRQHDMRQSPLLERAQRGRIDDFERGEAAAQHERNFIDQHVADRAQLAAEPEPVAQDAGVRERPAVGELVEGERIKVNPLVGWSASDVLKYIADAGLPRHPLAAKGFPSIGCLPCTSMVKPGEDERAGRWRGRGKTECGIHMGALDAGVNI